MLLKEPISHYNHFLMPTALTRAHKGAEGTELHAQPRLHLSHAAD